MRAWLVSLPLLAWSAPALACQPIPSAYVFVPAQAQAGAVGFAECPSECRITATVTDEDGIVVPGEVKQGDSFAVWHPAQPLTLGRRYTLVPSAPASTRGEGGTFEVVRAVDASVSVDVRVAARLVDTGRTCCPFGSSLSLGSCGRQACMVTHRVGQAQVSVSLQGALEKSSQWRYRATISADGVETTSRVRAYDGFSVDVLVPDDASHVCVIVDAVSVDDAMTVKVHESCQDVMLTLPRAESVEQDRISAFLSSCFGPDTHAPDAAARDASVPDASSGDAAVRDAAREDENPPLERANEAGCQLADNRAHVVGASLVWLTLAVRGRRRRRQ